MADRTSRTSLLTIVLVLVLGGCGSVANQEPADARSDGQTCQPSTEVCNDVDDNCDGVTDEGFDLQTDRANCGQCGTVCGELQRCSGTCVDLGPILFDQSHGNFSSYATFRSLLTTEGYNVAIGTSALLTDASLSGVAVLVLAITNNTTAYAATELAAIERAVEGGMGLLLITDIGTHHVQADPIAARFGLSFGGDIGIGAMTVTPHPISTGVTQIVRDLSAASIVIDANTVPILSAPGSGIFFAATPEGGAQTMLGRVVTVTDANMFADAFGGTGNPMMTPGTDNPVLAANTIAWLTQRL